MKKTTEETDGFYDAVEDASSCSWWKRDLKWVVFKEKADICEEKPGN